MSEVFDRTDLSGARFIAANVTGARFEHCDLSGVVMRGVEFIGVAIDGYVENVVVNGVDVAPLIEAELNRRQPDRAKMKPSDPAGYREAWDIIERRWAQTVERARQLPDAMLHESVDGEWSFIQTLRHLVFATDIWILRVMGGDPRPYHPLSLPFDQFEPHPEVPWDRDARPSLDEVLTLRRDRMDAVRRVLDGLTDEQLQSQTEPVEGPGWPPAKAFPVSMCLGIVLNEEWQHREYAERDLDVLTPGRSTVTG